jgi:hypothetical protein
MKMKHVISALSASILLAAVNCSFAKTPSCPSAEEIRMMGSEFLYAYNTKANTWLLISKPYPHDGIIWQTTFTFEPIIVIAEASQAIEFGEYAFKKSPLLVNPSSTSTSTSMACSYTSADMKYSVQAATPVKFGIKPQA